MTMTISTALSLIRQTTKRRGRKWEIGLNPSITGKENEYYKQQLEKLDGTSLSLATIKKKFDGQMCRKKSCRNIRHGHSHWSSDRSLNSRSGAEDKSARSPVILPNKL